MNTKLWNQMAHCAKVASKHLNPAPEIIYVEGEAEINIDNAIFIRGIAVENRGLGTDNNYLYPSLEAYEISVVVHDDGYFDHKAGVGLPPSEEEEPIATIDHAFEALTFAMVQYFKTITEDTINGEMDV